MNKKIIFHHPKNYLLSEYEPKIYLQERDEFQIVPMLMKRLKKFDVVFANLRFFTLWLYWSQKGSSDIPWPFHVLFSIKSSDTSKDIFYCFSQLLIANATRAVVPNRGATAPKSAICNTEY